MAQIVERLGRNDGWGLMDTPQSKEWYTWPWKVTHHAALRLEERQFSEILLKQIWGNAQEVRLTKKGTFAISGRHSGRKIEIVVNPLMQTRQLLIVTAYEVE